MKLTGKGQPAAQAAGHKGAQRPAQLRERVWLDLECDRVFQILMALHPSCSRDAKQLQQVVKASYLYTWMDRLSQKIGLEAEELQRLFALLPDELEEYRQVMLELKSGVHLPRQRKSVLDICRAESKLQEIKHLI